MKKLIADKIGRVVKNKSQVENELGVKIAVKGREVSIEGTPEDEYYAERIVEALNLGFPAEIAILIKEEDYVFEILNIKSYTKRKDFERIRGRIIGTDGKTLKVLESLTKCFFEVKDNNVGIIGHADNIKNDQEGIISLIRGAKQSKVYSYLEQHQVEPIYDLGLKEKGK